jgi:hypothetical protein
MDVRNSRYRKGGVFPLYKNEVSIRRLVGQASPAALLTPRVQSSTGGHTHGTQSAPGGEVVIPHPSPFGYVDDFTIAPTIGEIIYASAYATTGIKMPGRINLR